MTDRYPIPPLFVCCDEIVVGSDRLFWAAIRSSLIAAPVDLRQQPFDLRLWAPSLLAVLPINTLITRSYD
jgi:hypothetical protein